MAGLTSERDMGTDPLLLADIATAARISGAFRLRSGQISTTYFDKYRLESAPALLRRVVVALAEQITASGVRFDVLAGMELGGVPIATLLSQELGVPTAFVRKEAKAYGTCRLAEGADIRGRRLLIVEDVVTTGGAILDALPRLGADGAVIADAFCVILRDERGRQNLLEQGVTLRALCTMDELEAMTA